MGFKSYEKPEKTKEEIKELENNIIKQYFQNVDDKVCIDYTFVGNKVKKNYTNDLLNLTDYVINWTIEGTNTLNKTYCKIMIFNLGGFLGADGVMYSLCLFYYCFLNIPVDNKTENEIKINIDECLKSIDKGNIGKLKSIMKINLDEEILNNLRICKYILSTLFNDEINDFIYERINNTIMKKIISFFTKGIPKFCTCLLYWLDVHIHKTNINSVSEYLKKKNKINKDIIISNIFYNLNIDFFQKNNLFIIASDANIIKTKNFGGTFFGYPLEDLGEKAKKLIESDVNVEGGFLLSIKEQKKLFRFYLDRIRDLQDFFSKNKSVIDNINKGLDIETNLNIIVKEVHNFKKKYENESMITTTPLSNKNLNDNLNCDKIENITNKSKENNHCIKNKKNKEKKEMMRQIENILTEDNSNININESYEKYENEEDFQQPLIMNSPE